MTTIPVAAQLYQPGVHTVAPIQLPLGTVYVIFQPVMVPADYTDPAVSFALDFDQAPTSSGPWVDFIQNTFAGKAGYTHGIGRFGQRIDAVTGPTWIQGRLVVDGRAFTIGGTVSLLTAADLA